MELFPGIRSKVETHIPPIFPENHELKETMVPYKETRPEKTENVDWVFYVK